MPSKRKERIEDALRGAMLSILKDKPFERITVNEVVERAGVSKSTLYAHYPNPSVLVQDCYLHWNVYFGPQKKKRADYRDRYEAIRETMQVSAEKLLFFRENVNLAKVILGEERSFYELADLQLIEESLHVDHLEFEYGRSTEDFVRFEECACYIQAGDTGMIRRWFLGGMVEDIERVVKSMAYYSLCVTAGVVGHPIEPEYKEAVEAWHFEPRRG